MPAGTLLRRLHEQQYCNQDENQEDTGCNSQPADLVPIICVQIGRQLLITSSRVERLSEAPTYYKDYEATHGDEQDDPSAILDRGSPWLITERERRNRKPREKQEPDPAIEKGQLFLVHGDASIAE